MSVTLFTDKQFIDCLEINLMGSNEVHSNVRKQSRNSSTHHFDPRNSTWLPPVTSLFTLDTHMLVCLISLICQADLYNSCIDLSHFECVKLSVHVV